MGARHLEIPAGTRFGELTVVRHTGEKQGQGHVYELTCDCGQTTKRTNTSLVNAIKNGTSPCCEKCMYEVRAARMKEYHAKGGKSAKKKAAKASPPKPRVVATPPEEEEQQGEEVEEQEEQAEEQEDEDHPLNDPRVKQSFSTREQEIFDAFVAERSGQALRASQEQLEYQKTYVRVSHLFRFEQYRQGKISPQPPKYKYQWTTQGISLVYQDVRAHITVSGHAVMSLYHAPSGRKVEALYFPTVDTALRWFEDSVEGAR